MSIDNVKTIEIRLTVLKRSYTISEYLSYQKAVKKLELKAKYGIECGFKIKK